MSSYEQRRTGNAVPGDTQSSVRQNVVAAKELSEHGGQQKGKPTGLCAHKLVNPDDCQMGGKLDTIKREACRSVLNSRRRIGRPARKRYAMLANRTWENRPSGMTTGACGIVLHGSRIEAQRETFGSATEPCRGMRHRSTQTTGMKEQMEELYVEGLANHNGHRHAALAAMRGRARQTVPQALLKPR
jgi:hypothetical protein